MKSNNTVLDILTKWWFVCSVCLVGFILGSLGGEEWKIISVSIFHIGLVLCGAYFYKELS